MYAYLRGTLAVKGRDFVALDCGGVGYKIFVTEGYLQACKIGEEATLYASRRAGGGTIPRWVFERSGKRDV